MLSSSLLLICFVLFWYLYLFFYRTKENIFQHTDFLSLFFLLDGSGELDLEEFREALKSLGMTLTDIQFNELVIEVDQDGSGEIDREEFEVAAATMHADLSEAAGRGLRIQIVTGVLGLWTLVGMVVFTFTENWEVQESFYFSFVTLATIGLGDFFPESRIGHYFLIVFITGGLGMLSVMLTLIEGLMADNEKSRKLDLEKTRANAVKEKQKEEKKRLEELQKELEKIRKEANEEEISNGEKKSEQKSKVRSSWGSIKNAFKASRANKSSNSKKVKTDQVVNLHVAEIEENLQDTNIEKEAEEEEGGEEEVVLNHSNPMTPTLLTPRSSIKNWGGERGDGLDYVYSVGSGSINVKD